MQRLARFQRASFYPSDWEDTVSEFLELFDPHRYQYIYRPHDGHSWLSAKEEWRLTDTEILKAVANVHPKYLLGCRFGKQTRFAVIDIDAGSEYHNLRSYQKIKAVLSDAGITKLVPFRSSESNGWHLYIFFEEFVNSAQLRKALVQIFSYTKLRIKSGTLEVFPNVSEHSAGMGLRLPLQPGFAFLNDKNLEVNVERWELSPTKALDYFLDEANSCANSFHQFVALCKYAQQLAEKQDKVVELRARTKELPANVITMPKLPAAVSGEHLQTVQEIFSGLPPGIRTDDWYRGRNYHQDGLTGESQRADAIRCLSHYFFYGDPSRSLPALGYGYETERELAIKQILELNHNGFSKDLNRGDLDALSQAERAAHWIPPHKRTEETKKYTPIQPIAWIRKNANRKADARKRIQKALEALQARGGSFTTVELHESADCSRETLYKHSDIWRQAYEDLAEGFFASCTDEYNGVVGVGSSETKPLPLPDKKEMPPGILAARRIIYELRMRDKKTAKKKNVYLRNIYSAQEERWSAELTRLGAVENLSLAELKSLIPVLISLRARASDEDSEKMVLQLLDRFRERIDWLSNSEELSLNANHKPQTSRNRSTDEEL